MTRSAVCVVGGLLAACGSRTGLDALDIPGRSVPNELAPTDADPPRGVAVVDGEAAAGEVLSDDGGDTTAFAMPDGGEDHSCVLGVMNREVSPIADVFGTVVRYAGGADLPAGHYRVEYVDGCMKYSGNQDWALHAYGDGSIAWWLVGQSTSDRIAMPPGTVGFLVGSGGFATFDACVAANRKLAPLELDFRGGKLGVWLRDDPYVDNVAGENGRSPRWRIVFSDGCPI